MQIYFVRHGKTEWNLQRRFQGAHGDSPLLPQSLIDIQKLGGFLAGTKFAGIYSSPLKRAKATAEGLVKTLSCPLAVKIDDRLREFDLGAMEGLTFTEAQTNYPKQVTDIWDHPEKYDGHSIGGENYSEVIARGKSFGHDIALKFKADDKVIALSHGAALGAIMGGLLGYPLSDIRRNGGLSNTSLTILETKDKGKTFDALVWNETGFLGRKMVNSDSL